MKISPYLSFNGQCKEAFQYYEKVLDAKIIFMMTHGESPMAAQTAANWQDKIMHASLSIEGMVLSGADMPEPHYHLPKGVAIALSLDDIPRAERIFAGLAEGGKVDMQLAETFWAHRFGMLRDRFGIPWMVNCEKPMPQAKPV